MALFTADAAVRGGMPLVVDLLHFVATGAAPAAAGFVIEGGSRRQQNQRRDEERGYEQDLLHERTFEPFHASSRWWDAR